jgi:L-fuconolactonase
VSGLVTEADWRRWKASDLRPYVERAVEVFGPDRLMFGSDWPVCLLAGSYSEVWEATAEILGTLLGTSLESVMGACAARVYRLELSAPQT